MSKNATLHSQLRANAIMDTQPLHVIEDHVAARRRFSLLRNVKLRDELDPVMTDASGRKWGERMPEQPLFFHINEHYFAEVGAMDARQKEQEIKALRHVIHDLLEQYHIPATAYIPVKWMTGKEEYEPPCVIEMRCDMEEIVPRREREEVRRKVQAEAEANPEKIPELAEKHDCKRLIERSEKWRHSLDLSYAASDRYLAEKGVAHIREQLLHLQAEIDTEKQQAEQNRIQVKMG